MQTSGGKTLLVSVVAISVALAGCAQTYKTPQQAAANACSSLGPRATSGALIGAVAGAGAGAAIGAAAGSGNDAAYAALAGALIGAVIGMTKGKQLDARDCATAQAALQGIGTASTGDAIAWSTPATGNRGLYKPVSDTYTSREGQVCRRIQASYYMQGHAAVEDDSGIVCRTFDGNWVRQPAGIGAPA